MPKHVTSIESDDVSNMEQNQKGRLIHSLGRAILTGDYKPGDTLPGEILYSATLGVSRGGYREAVQCLIAKGLVESRRKVGTRVLPRHRWSILDRDVLSWAFAGDVDNELLQSLFELQAANEPFAASLAAHRRDKTDLQILKAAIAEMGNYNLSVGAEQSAVLKFHESMLNASRSEAFISLGPAISNIIEWRFKNNRCNFAFNNGQLARYKRAYEAVCNSDANHAKYAMSQILNYSHYYTI
ncbi:MAG: FadR/GntR family transcriptional regulator [Rhizorhabdus sp.]